MRSRHDKTVSWTVSSVLGDEYHTLQAKLNFLEEVPNLKWRLSPLWYVDPTVFLLGLSFLESVSDFFRDGAVCHTKLPCF